VPLKLYTKESKVDIPLQIQGAAKMEKFILENDNAKNFFINYIKSNISSSQEDGINNPE